MLDILVAVLLAGGPAIAQPPQRPAFVSPEVMPELFRTVASISGSLVPSDFGDRFGAALADADRIRKDYRLIWIGSGTQDLFYGGAQALVSRLTASQIPHQFYQVPGAHVMPVFRKELVELLPRLFR
jgi:enterochelin esterase-like enzyme